MENKDTATEQRNRKNRPNKRKVVRTHFEAMLNRHFDTLWLTRHSTMRRSECKNKKWNVKTQLVNGREGRKKTRQLIKCWNKLWKKRLRSFCGSWKCVLLRLGACLYGIFFLFYLTFLVHFTLHTVLYASCVVGSLHFGLTNTMCLAQYRQQKHINSNTK